MFANFLGGQGGNYEGATTQRIHRELFGNSMIDYVELAWIETEDKPTAKVMEGRFRPPFA